MLKWIKIGKDLNKLSSTRWKFTYLEFSNHVAHVVYQKKSYVVVNKNVILFTHALPGYNTICTFFDQVILSKNGRFWKNLNAARSTTFGIILLRYASLWTNFLKLLDRLLREVSLSSGLVVDRVIPTGGSYMSHSLMTASIQRRVNRSCFLAEKLWLWKELDPDTLGLINQNLMLYNWSIDAL